MSPIMNDITMNIMKCKSFRLIVVSSRLNYTQTKLEYPTSTKNIMDKEKKSHPFQKIHFWKSKAEFCQSLVEQVLHNKDGLVAINKPYGISPREAMNEAVKKHRKSSGIPHEVDYVLTDAIPIIARTLGYDSLEIIKTPEKYTSGVVLLGASDKVTKAVNKSMRIAEAARIISRTFWTITRKVPKQLHGEKRVAMTLKRSKDRTRPVPVIIDSWSKNERERGDIKILNVQYKVLSHGTYNLTSLLEIKSSTTQWHAVRLFAASVLMSPILGDTMYGSRVQNIMGKWVLVNPMVDAAHIPPKLDPELLKVLQLTKYNDSIIPVHMHLREMYLPSFLKKENDIVITAPLCPEFLWTFKQCQFDEKILERTTKTDCFKTLALEKRNPII